MSNDDQPEFDDVNDGSGQGPTIASMVDLFKEDSPLAVIDRSDLENWAICPYMAGCKMSGLVKPNSLVLQAGQLIHDALSAATLYYVENYVELLNMGHQGIIAGELSQFVMGDILRGRPDLQPDAIDGISSSLKNWSWFLSTVHAGNILSFDGGNKTQMSSQYAKPYDDLGVLVTSELDLVLATESPDAIEVYDYKTGYSPHSHASVKKTFQFIMHADLLFHHFETVQSIYYRVWGTRFNKATHRAEFKRSELHQYESLVRKAIESFAEHKSKPRAKLPCWPVAAKCSECDCILLCPEADKSEKDIESDPAGYLAQVSLVESKLTAMKKVASAKVKRDGRDIVGDGIAYGKGKPKKQEPKITLYTINSTESEKDNGSDNDDGNE